MATGEARGGLWGLKLDEIDAASSFLMLPMPLLFSLFFFPHESPHEHLTEIFGKNAASALLVSVTSNIYPIGSMC